MYPLSLVYQKLIVEQAAGKWSSLEDKKFEVERRKAFEERLEKSGPRGSWQVAQVHQTGGSVETIGQARGREGTGQEVWTNG